MEKKYDLGSFIEMKKPHVCRVKSTGKKANLWEITRVGADIKIRCTNCQHEILLARWAFERRLKRVTPPLASDIIKRKRR